MRKKIVILALLIVVSVFFVTLSYAQPKAKEPIKIGCLYPLTGRMVGYGLPTKAAIEYTCDKINKEGGILGRPVEPIIRDSKLNPENALRECRDLVENQKCMFVGGALSSAVSLACSLYAKEQNGKFLWTSYCASANAIIEEKGHRYTSRVSINEDSGHKSIAVYAARMYGRKVKRVACINPDYIAGRDGQRTFIQAWNKLVPGTEVVADLYPPLGCSDYSAYITKVMASKPDMIQTVIYGGDLQVFLRQGEPYGLLKIPLAAAWLGVMPFLNPIRKGDLGAPIGAIGSTPYAFYLIDHPDSIKFYEEVNKKSGWYPDMMGYSPYPYMYFLKKAMEKAKTTTDLEKIIDALEDLTIDWFGIPLTMRGCDHQTMHPWWIGKVNWDPKGKFPMPILVEDIVMVDDYKSLYKSCDEISALRKK